MNKIFIDGQVGTTGLQIHERLSDRQDIEILSISDKNRKDPTVKHAIICEADIVILCLPDDAARETASLASDTSARILDASTAHRILPDWVYGLPELTKNQRQKISEATRVSNPGCYPTGFLLSIAPLVNSGLLRKDIRLSISAVSGYSGGGHKMIEQYELRQQQLLAWEAAPFARACHPREEHLLPLMVASIVGGIWLGTVTLPDNAESHLYSAERLLEQQSHGEAWDEVALALELNPISGRAYLLRGQILADLDDVARARNVLDLAITIARQTGDRDTEEDAIELFNALSSR